MEFLLLISIAVLAACLLLLLAFLKKITTGRVNRPDDVIEGRAEGAAPRMPVNRQQAGRVRRIVMGRQGDDTDDEAEIFGPPSDEKIGTKKIKKLKEREERKQMREAELAEREEKKKREALAEEHRKKEEAKAATIAAAQQEEEMKRKEEEERREHEEYLKLKEGFTVDEEGTQDAELGENTQSLLQEFIDYIKKTKVVMLEDLAHHFRLKTQDCISRVKYLQEENQLSGVMDDRGKFIHITRDEYEAVAKFIKQRGRVSIADLVESSNRLINLNPDLVTTKGNSEQLLTS